jgi:DeoR/GlpR family transcriptional regulator of sugar metabolism
VLADSSKAGKVSFARAGHWDKIHMLITDRQLTKNFAKEISQLGIKLVRT